MTWTEVSTPDGPMRVFEAAPSGEARGAVIVVQEAFGVNHHIQDVAGRLAKEGWYAAAPEFFHRAGPEPVAPYDDFSKVMALYEGLDQAGMLRDADATLELLHGRGFGDASSAPWAFVGRLCRLPHRRPPADRRIRRPSTAGGSCPPATFRASHRWSMRHPT